MAKNQGHLEKQRMKARLKSKLEAEKDRLKKDMNVQLNEQKSKTFKKGVRVLQEVLLDNNGPTHSSTTPYFDHSRYHIRGRVRSSRSDPKLDGNPVHDTLDPHGAALKLQHRRSRSQGSEGLMGLQIENALKKDIMAQIDLLSSSTPRKRSSADSTRADGSSSQDHMNVAGKRPRF